MTAVLGWHPGAMRPGTDVTENGLRHLLNEWDPIGVADAVQEEYDCMLVPLLQWLPGAPTRRRSVSSCGMSWKTTSVSPLFRQSRKRWLPG